MLFLLITEAVLTDCHGNCFRGRVNGSDACKERNPHDHWALLVMHGKTVGRDFARTCSGMCRLIVHAKQACVLGKNTVHFLNRHWLLKYCQ